MRPYKYLIPSQQVCLLHLRVRIYTLHDEDIAPARAGVEPVRLQNRTRASRHQYIAVTLRLPFPPPKTVIYFISPCLRLLSCMRCRHRTHHSATPLHSPFKNNALFLCPLFYVFFNVGCLVDVSILRLIILTKGNAPCHLITEDQPATKYRP